MTIDFFYEKAFWGFLALFAATIRIIYKLYDQLKQADLDLRLKEQAEEFDKKINSLKADIQSQIEKLR